MDKDETLTGTRGVSSPIHRTGYHDVTIVAASRATFEPASRPASCGFGRQREQKQSSFLSHGMDTPPPQLPSRISYSSKYHEIMPRDPLDPNPGEVSPSDENQSSVANAGGQQFTSYNEAEYAENLNLAALQTRTNERNELHPFSQILSISNVDDCVKVEDGAFPPHERCSREKFQYRLTKCPELSLGLFSLPKQSSTEGKPSPTLLAHIVATQTTDVSVTDASMRYPEDWQSPDSKLPKAGSVPLGHQVHGKTIAIHSLAVLPAHQNKGLGRTIMRSYIQRMEDAGTADRLALLAHNHLVGYYEKLGFTNRGESKATFGGGGWYDLAYEFKEKHFGDTDSEEGDEGEVPG